MSTQQNSIRILRDVFADDPELYVDDYLIHVYGRRRNDTVKFASQIKAVRLVNKHVHIAYVSLGKTETLSLPTWTIARMHPVVKQCVMFSMDDFVCDVWFINRTALFLTDHLPR